jgi:hypothetical protein
LIDEGKEELNDTEIIFEKMKMVKEHTDDDTDNPKSKRYSIIAKDIMERINNLRAEIDPTTSISSISVKTSRRSSTSRISATAATTPRSTPSRPSWIPPRWAIST